ncbi:uncharacterized protein LJ206_011788 isoform 1-T1 [Theristicus caerulescens]
MRMWSQRERQEEGRLRAECWGRVGAAGQRVPPGPCEQSSLPVAADLRFRHFQLGKRQQQPLLSLAARAAVVGSWLGAGAVRPSSWESRATWGAAVARGGRGPYVAFTDGIHRAVRGETEQTRDGMWQQPVSAAGSQCFSDVRPKILLQKNS